MRKKDKRAGIVWNPWKMLVLNGAVGEVSLQRGSKQEQKSAKMCRK